MFQLLDDCSCYHLHHCCCLFGRSIPRIRHKTGRTRMQQSIWWLHWLLKLRLRRSVGQFWCCPAAYDGLVVIVSELDIVNQCSWRLYFSSCHGHKYCFTLLSSSELVISPVWAGAICPPPYPFTSPLSTLSSTFPVFGRLLRVDLIKWVSNVRTAATGVKTAMRPFAKVLWTLGRYDIISFKVLIRVLVLCVCSMGSLRQASWWTWQISSTLTLFLICSLLMVRTYHWFCHVIVI